MKFNIPDEYKNKAGVYQILNLVNGKCYIGSTQKLKHRHVGHLSKLNTGRHPNPLLLNSFRRYGKEAFEFNLLTLCERVERETGAEFAKRLLDIENTKIKEYASNTKECGYNLRNVAESNFGYKLSVGTVEKMKRGKDSVEVVLKRSLASKGLLGYDSGTFIQTVKEVRFLLTKGLGVAVVTELTGAPRNLYYTIKNKNAYGEITLNTDDIAQLEMRFSSERIVSVAQIVKNKKHINVRNSVRGRPGKLLSVHDVLQIKVMLLENKSCQEMADRFGISLRYASSITGGKAWSHVTGITKSIRKRGEKHVQAKYSDETVRQALSLMKEGFRNYEICQKLVLPKSFISQLRRGVTRKHLINIE